MKDLFRWVAIGVLVALTGPAEGTLVTYSSVQFTGTANNRAITIRLQTQGTLYGTNAIFGMPLTLQPTNGLRTFNLLPSSYTLQVDQVPTLFPFSVSDSTNTYSIWDLVSRGIYIISSAGSATNTVAVGGDSKIIVRTNSSGNVFTLDGSGLASLADMAAASNALFQSIQTAAGAAGVVSFNSRTGMISLLSADVSAALGYTPGTNGAAGTNSQSYIIGTGLNLSNNTLSVAPTQAFTSMLASTVTVTHIDGYISSNNIPDGSISTQKMDAAAYLAFLGGGSGSQTPLLSAINGNSQVITNLGGLQVGGSGPTIFGQPPIADGSAITNLAGGNLQDNSVSSNKLDAATRAMLGTGGGGGSQTPLLSAINGNNQVISNLAGLQVGGSGPTVFGQPPIGDGSGFTNLTTSSSTNSGVSTSNDYVHIRVNQRMRQAAGLNRPMGAQMNSLNWASQYIDGANEMLTNGMVAAGYTVMLGNNGWLTNRASDGTLQASVYLTNNIPGLISGLKANGMDFAGFMESWTNNSNGTGIDRDGVQATLNPSRAYSDGYQLASMGLKGLWISVWPSLTNLDEQYCDEQLARGLDDAVAASTNGDGKPLFLFTAITPQPTIPSWVPTIYNAVYYNGTNGDFSTLGPLHWQQSVLMNLLQYNNVISPYSSRMAFIVTHSLVPTWADTNYTRASMGLACMARWPLFTANPVHGAFSGPELTILTNPAAIKIYREAMAVPVTLVQSNMTGTTWSIPLANGDLAVGVWNYSTNSVSSFSIPLASFTGLGTNVAQAMDVFSLASSSMTDALNCTVNTNGLNLYRLSRGPAAVTAAGNNVFSGLNTFTGTATFTNGAGGNAFLPSVAAPVVSSSGGWFWTSNKVLFWATDTKTNVISDGR